jgi:uncharacterized protein Veg
MVSMVNKNDVSQIKKDIKEFIGSAVWLESGKGKQKAVRQKGIIERAYPSIFTILLCDGGASKRTISYSYADVLTKAIEITVCE